MTTTSYPPAATGPNLAGLDVEVLPFVPSELASPGYRQIPGDEGGEGVILHCDGGRAYVMTPAGNVWGVGLPRLRFLSPEKARAQVRA